MKKISFGNVGSNQYAVKHRGLTGYTIYFVTVIAITMLLIAYQGAKHNLEMHQPIISPIGDLRDGKVYAAEVKKDSENPEDETVQQKDIVAYVKQVFGKDSDKALQLLSCENHALNPKAVNGWNNTPAGSLDKGLFQINNHWQKIDNDAFLFDYKVNTQLAYNIFSRDGYSFKLWTCGRKLGI